MTEHIRPTILLVDDEEMILNSLKSFFAIEGGYNLLTYSSPVQALRDLPITICGAGRQTRSFCYVSDLIEGLVKLMAKPQDFCGPVNLGNPNECTILELAQLILDLTGSKSVIKHVPMPSDDPCRRCPDIRQAIAELDWRPGIALREGLLHTIDYFDKQLRTGNVAPAMQPAATA